MRILISMKTIRPFMSETVKRIAAGQKLVTMECDLSDRTAAARRASLMPFLLLGFIVVVYTLLVPILQNWMMALFAVGPVMILTAYFGIPVSRMKAGLYFKKIDVYENGARLKGTVGKNAEYTIEFICALFSAVS